MDWSTILPEVGIGSGWALVAVGVMLLMRGKLVPRSSLDDVIHDRDEWRAESRVKDAQIAERDEQLRLVGGEVGANILHVMGSLQELREDRHRGEVDR